MTHTEMVEQKNAALRTAQGAVAGRLLTSDTVALISMLLALYWQQELLHDNA